MSLPTAGSTPLTGASRAAGAPRDLADSQAERRFLEAYEQYHQALYRYCRSILRSDEDAQDALQTTMLKAFSALQDDTRDLDLRPWLFRVAHNECITLVRRRKATTPLELTHDVGVDTLPQAVEDRARLAQLQRDLTDLPERQRSALILREFSGLSHEEIAVVLDSSARAIKQTIFEARRGLHECAEGRGMTCDTVQRTLSDADGRVVRSRKIRAHVRDCDSCALFAAAMTERPQQLGALVPALPVFAASALLADLLGGSGSAALGAGAGAGVAGTAAVGAASATTAATGAAGATAAGAAGAAAATTTGASAMAGATGGTLLAGLSGKAAAVIAAAVVATGGGAATVATVAGPSGAKTEQRSSDPSGPGRGAAVPSAAGTGAASSDTSPRSAATPTTPRTAAEAKAAAAAAKAARDARAGSNEPGASAPGRAAAAAAKDAATARQAAATADAATKRGTGQQKAATKRATSKNTDRSGTSTRPSPSSTKPAARQPAPAKKTPSTPSAPSTDTPTTQKPAAKSPRVEASPAPAASAPEPPAPAAPERVAAMPDASTAAGRDAK